MLTAQAFKNTACIVLYQDGKNFQKEISRDGTSLTQRPVCVTSGSLSLSYTWIQPPVISSHGSATGEQNNLLVRVEAEGVDAHSDVCQPHHAEGTVLNRRRRQ